MIGGTLTLAVIAYWFIPNGISARETARLIQCKNHFKQWSGPFIAHAIILTDDDEVASVDSFPLFPAEQMHGDHKYEYGFYRRDHETGELIWVESDKISEPVFHEARGKVREFRSTRDFYFRQGKTLAEMKTAWGQ
jgi:hypothetical protein